METIIYKTILFKQIEDFPNYYVSKCGKVYSKKRNIILKSKNDGRGYFKVNIKSTSTSVHRLVALTWISNLENKPEVNHINGIRNDNRVENLEWNTRLENQQHSWRELKRVGSLKNKFGKNHPKSKKVVQYDLDGNLIKTWDSIIDIEKNLNINSGNICSVCKGNYKTAGGFKWKYYF